MVSIIRKLFQQVKAFAVGKGEQRTTDPRLLLKFAGSRFYNSLRPEERLTLYTAIYKSNPVARGAVETLVKMTNTRMIPKSGDPDTDEAMTEIWETVNGSHANGMLLRSANIWGYSVGEMVYPDMEFERIAVPLSPDVRLKADQFGNLEYIRQMYRVHQREALIPAAKFIVLQRDQTDTFDMYGASLFEAAVDQFEALCQILDAQLKVYMRLGKPRYVVTIPSEGLTVEEFKSRLEQAKTVFGQLAEGSDLYMPEGVEVKIIGAESFGQKFESETRLLISTILSNTQIPPALLNVNIQSAGTESYARQSVICFTTLLNNLQDACAAAWNKSFWPLAQQLYGLRTTPKMTFERPRLLEQQQEEKAREAKRLNDWWEVVKGRDIEWFVQRLGAKAEEFDLSILKEQVEREREQNVADEISNDETNANASTKLTDEQATGNTNG